MILHLRNIFKELSPLERQAYAILFVITPVLLIGLINLAPVYSWIKICAIAAVVAIALGLLAIVYSGSRKSRDDRLDDDFERDKDTSSSGIPPMPSTPPTITLERLSPSQIHDTSKPGRERLTEVLGVISQQLSDEALSKQREIDATQRMEAAKAQLLADTTVYYDMVPGPLYYIRRGLWRTVVVLLIAAVAVYGCIVAAQTNGNLVWLGGAALSIAAFSWYAVRWYGDWKWTRRQLIGNQAFVKEPANGWFGWYGASYSVSILHCGNTVIRRTWYERLLRQHTATVSVDTQFENEKQGDVPGKNTDVFNKMSNMREPETYRSIIIKRHDELTFGQPGIIRRSEHR